MMWSANNRCGFDAEKCAQPWTVNASIYIQGITRWASGWHTLRVWLTDYAAHVRLYDINVLYSADWPNASFTGGLIDGAYTGTLTAGNLTVHAFEGFGRISSARVQVFRPDGTETVNSYQPNSCTALCPSDWAPDMGTVDPVALGWTTGRYHVVATITDSIGRYAPYDWYIDYYATSWTYGNRGGAPNSVDTDARTRRS